MSIKQYDFDGRTYQIFRDSKTSEIIDVKRKGVYWEEGCRNFAYSECIHAMLNRIDELEQENSVLKAVTGNC